MFTVQAPSTTFNSWCLPILHPNSFVTPVGTLPLQIIETSGHPVAAEFSPGAISHRTAVFPSDSTAKAWRKPQSTLQTLWLWRRSSPCIRADDPSVKPCFTFANEIGGRYCFQAYLANCSNIFFFLKVAH